MNLHRFAVVNKYLSLFFRLLFCVTYFKSDVGPKMALWITSAGIKIVQFIERMMFKYREGGGGGGIYDVAFK